MTSGLDNPGAEPSSPPVLTASSSQDKPRFVFVIGTGRCGSTLVHDVMAKHPDVGFVSNLDDRMAPLRLKGRWNNAIYRRVPLGLTQKGRLRFAPSEAYNVLAQEVSPSIANPFRDLHAADATPWLSDRLRRFFEARAHAQDRGLFLHKFTGWPRVGFINRVFPEARFVHIVRDGRAVANSLAQWPLWKGHRGPSEWGWGPLPDRYARRWVNSGRSFVVLAGLQWNLLMDAFEDAKSLVSEDRWLEVKYEDFVSDPRSKTGELLRFMGLEWNPHFEASFAKHSFRTNRSQAFLADLAPEDTAKLEEHLAVHLKRLGYVSKPEISREVAS